MRSKIAIVSILAMGFVTSGAGATLAFQGSSGSGNASTAGYAPQPNVPNSPGEDDTGDDTSNGNGDETTGNPTQTLSPGSESSTGDETQATRQAGADDGKLPFTGLAAIPVIAIGLGLLGTGVLLQRRTARERG